MTDDTLAVKTGFPSAGPRRPCPPAAPIFVALACALAAGCTQNPYAAHDHRVFVVAQTAEPRSLDPLLESGPTAEEIGSLIYSYLLRIGPRGELEPDLAAQVPTRGNGGISADGRTIVYHLRPGVRWQDGRPFSAADVIATYRAIMDPRNAVPSRLGFDEVASLAAPTRLTLRVRLRQRFAPFLTYFFEPENYPVLPAHVLAHGQPLAGSLFDASPVGTGPFHVVAWRRGEHLDLAANPHYYAGRPKIDRLRIEFVPSPQTVVERLKTGEADAYIGADPSVVVQLQGMRRLDVRTSPIYGFLSLTFQTRDAALRDPRVRRRIAHLFDIPRDVRLASHGVLDARDAPRGLFTWAYVPARTPPSTAALPPQLTLAFDGTRQLERTLALVMQQEARRAGLSLVLRSFSAQQFAATAAGQGPLASGDFQLALQEIATGADPETSWLLACDQIPSTGYNIARFCDRSVDRALADALRTNDRTRRLRDYAFVQQAVARDVPFVAMAQLREVDAVPAGMRGFHPSLETAYYRAERWQLPAEH